MVKTKKSAEIENSALKKSLKLINDNLISKNKFVEALAQLVFLSKDYFNKPELWLNVAFVYTRMAHWSKALSAVETVFTLCEKTPNEKCYWGGKHLRALSLFSLGLKEDACVEIDAVAAALPSNKGVWLLRAYIHGHTNNNPEVSLRVAKDWAQRFADPITAKSKKIVIKNKSKEKKIKVGYVTADFRNHSVAFFMMPIIEHHNHDVNEIFVYSNGPEDSVSEKMKKHVDVWRNVLNKNDKEVFELIRKDEIDILVDLSGFTHGHRLEVFAMRAAPIQVTWLGYMLPLGMKAMEYRLVDENIAPLDHQKFYSEKLVYLNCMATYMPPAYSPFYDGLPMLREGYPTFISLNSSAKITDKILKVWGTILRKIPNAKMIIMVKEDNAEVARESILDRVQRAEMPLERVSVLPQVPLNNFMELGHIADVMLDTSPISGGTTTLHALWMGLPIITMDGQRGVDASTARTLVGAKKCADRCNEKDFFGGFIAYNFEEYIQAAVDIVKNPDALLLNRKSSRKVMLSTSLMQYSQRAADLELAYRKMWINKVSE